MRPRWQNLSRQNFRSRRVLRGAVAGEHQDRTHAGIASALHVNRLVADEPGARQVETEVALRLHHHARGRFAPRRAHLGRFRTEIGGVDQIRSEEAEEARVHGLRSPARYSASTGGRSRFGW